MLAQCPSQLYKAQLRGHEEDENYRCLATFNFGDYLDESRKPFGAITVLNDETLAPQKTKSFATKETAQIILIPLVGTIEFGNKNYISTEEILTFTAQKESTFQLQNPYETELINYLQIRLKPTVGTANSVAKKRFNFSTRNELFFIYQSEAVTISIGIFDSRKEGLYHLSQKENGIFAFAINGAFEFQNRLLESRDGLALWEIAETEFEALTENAILLLIETALQD